MSHLLADCGQGPCGGDSFGSPCPQPVSDRGSEPGPHAEVDDEVDGGVGHLTHVDKGLDDVERVAELAWGGKQCNNLREECQDPEKRRKIHVTWRGFMEIIQRFTFPLINFVPSHLISFPPLPLLPVP